MRTATVFLFLAVLVAPLQAQEQIVIPLEPPTVNVEVLPAPVEVRVIVAEPDSAAQARDEAAARAIESIAAYLAECGCVDGSTSTEQRVRQGALLLILSYAAWQLQRIASRELADTNVEVEVTAPEPPEHPVEPPEHDDESEGQGRE